MRIYHRPIDQGDLDDARTFAVATGALESLVVPAHGVDGELTVVSGITVIAGDEIAERITSSALVRWDEDRPSLATDRLDLMLRLASTALLDPVGIQDLPPLALNELPPALVEYGIEPQDLLERKAFRLLTATFRFGGVRYGESARGKRLPDAVLDWPDGSATSALLDCKAASSGYLMDSDHFLRFVNYWETPLGTPPRRYGDWAWVQHMIASTAPRTGRLAVVLPHGALFRGGTEGEIRSRILDLDLIEAVIGLGPNLFYGTQLAACILVARRRKSVERREKVLLVDASDLFRKGKNQNTLEPEHVDQLIRTYEGFEDEGGRSRVVSLAHR